MVLPTSITDHSVGTSFLFHVVDPFSVRTEWFGGDERKVFIVDAVFSPAILYSIICDSLDNFFRKDMPLRSSYGITYYMESYKYFGQ